MYIFKLNTSIITLIHRVNLRLRSRNFTFYTRISSSSPREIFKSRPRFIFITLQASIQIPLRINERNFKYNHFHTRFITLSSSILHIIKPNFSTRACKSNLFQAFNFLFLTNESQCCALGNRNSQIRI